MNAPTPIDRHAIPEKVAQAILMAALRLSKSPRRNSMAFLDLITAVNDACGDDSLLEQINEWRDYHGLDGAECLSCGGTDCACDIRFAETREARSSFGMGGKAVVA
jgi:hypothetical protein